MAQVRARFTWPWMERTPTMAQNPFRLPVSQLPWKPPELYPGIMSFF
jgi:hypothetical protein